MTTTYRAMMITKPGGPEVLQQVDLPVTEPGPGELRVRVRACGVGATDFAMLAGSYAFAPKPPLVGGYEIAGVIEALGEGVTDFHVGQRVAALTVHGGFAERLVRGAEHFVPIPDEVSDVEAAAVILNYVSAWQMIHRAAKVQAGESALVTGAGGGVGTALLQLLQLAGAKTYGAASSRKHGLIAKLGATPIDYRAGPDRPSHPRSPNRRASMSPSMRSAVRTSANASARCGAAARWSATVSWRSMASLRRRACSSMSLQVAACAGAAAPSTASRCRTERTRSPFSKTCRKSWRWSRSRKIEPVISAVFPLRDARKALELLATGTVEGKIVLTCD